MATKLANALRAQAAIDRITQAVAGVTGTALVLPTHRDPDMERALSYEAIADALESTKPAPAGAVGSVTKETVETTPVVKHKGKAG